MTEQPVNPSPQAAPQDLTPEEVKDLFDESTAPKEDHGMSALEPALEGSDHAEANAAAEEEDKGMQATAPILPDEAVEDNPPLPPSSAMQGAPLFSADATLLPGTRSTPPVAAPPVDPSLPPNPTLVDELVTKKALHDLWKEADALQTRINAEVNDINRARALLNQIQAARNYLLAGRDNYEEAARALSEVAYQLAFLQRVRKASKQVGVKLLLYEVAWAFLMGIAMFVVPWALRRWAPFFGYANGATTGLQSVQWLVDGFKTMFWGSLGGVTGALYALWRHVADKQDFDPQYAMWYITNPIMGFALGAFIYLIMQAGLLSMTSGQQAAMASAVPTFVLAWLSGFQQNVAYDIVRRILKVFQLEDNTPTTPPPPTSGAGSSAS